MAYRVEIGPSALREVEDAYQYIAQEAPAPAVEWFNGLVDAVYSLEEFPGRCRLAPESEEAGRKIHQLVYGLYRILFVIAGEDVVRILHIRHGARQTMNPDDIAT